MSAYCVPGIFMDFIGSWLEPYREKQSYNSHIDGRGNLRTKEVKNLPKLTELTSNRMGTWTQVCLTPRARMCVSQQDTGGWLWEQGADQREDQHGLESVITPLNRLWPTVARISALSTLALSSIAGVLFVGLKWGNTHGVWGAITMMKKLRTGGMDEEEKDHIKHPWGMFRIPVLPGGTQQ